MSKFDPSAANTATQLTGANAGVSLDPRNYTGKIVAQDWMVNSPYLATQMQISSGPDGLQKLNVVVPRGAANVPTGCLFSQDTGVAILGVPNKLEGKPAKMGYICSRGSDHKDSWQGYVGLPLTSAIEVITTAFDSDLNYVADDLLYPECVEGVFTGGFTKVGAKTKDNAGGTISINCPIVGVVSPGFYNNGQENVGDAESLGGQGFIGVPFLHLFPIYDIVRGEAVSQA